MKKTIIVLLLTLAVSAAQPILAAQYWILFDADGYVVALTAWSPAPKEYTLHEIGEIPQNILRGCYKLINGEFVLDPARNAQWELENPEPEPEPDPEGE